MKVFSLKLLAMFTAIALQMAELPAFSLELPPIAPEEQGTFPLSNQTENNHTDGDQRFETVRLEGKVISSDVKSKNFIKTRDLSNVIAEKISLLVVTLTQRQGGSNNKLVQIASKTTEISRDQHLKLLAVPHYDIESTKKKVDSDELRLALSQQTRKSGEVKFKETFPIIQRIQKGVNYNFTLNGKSPAAAPASTPNIRYGLVVQDIIPTQAPSIASLESSIDDDMMYARKAHVVYTIDKLSEDKSRQRVFAPIVESYTSEIGSQGPRAEQIFRRPSTDVNMHIEAANGDDTVSDKVGAGSMPGGKVTFTQADGLWSTQIITTSKVGVDNTTHNAKLPLVGEANITRKFDKSFKTLVTSANNLLAKPSAPKVNIHHLVTEKRYAGEVLVQKERYQWGLTVEPRAGWTPGQPVSHKGDKVSLKIQNSF